MTEGARETPAGRAPGAAGETEGAAGTARASEKASAAPTSRPGETEGAARQKRLGRNGLIAFLTFLSAFPPLSTDLYLPALPGMTRYFSVPEYQTNLTLLLFFVFYAVATLFWGPLSDRYGRRPILLVGLVCYAVAGGLCAVSTDIFQLIAFRVVQAVGAGAATAVATAIIKDVYRGRRRETTLALVQSMVVISPAVAPVLGALLLNLTSWRGVFVAQAVLGVGVLGGAVAYVETLEVRTLGNFVAAVGRLGTVLKNEAFARLLLVFSLLSITSLAFITSSSYIYEEMFGVSSQVYSYFFAIYAVGLALGAPLYVRFSRTRRRTSIITWCFAVLILSGGLIMAAGKYGPWPFIVTLLPGGMALSVSRPGATYLMLDQHEGDAGSASALMSASSMVMGSIGMVIVSLHLTDRVHLIGLLNIAVGLVSGALWLTTAKPLLVRARKAHSAGSAPDTVT
jgi:MFS transporter, DHA1 family, multidrug resistance protein